MKSFKLRHKIIIFYVTVIVLLSLAISSVLLMRTGAIIRREFQERVYSITANVAKEAELGVMVENPKLLREQIVALREVRDFTFIRIIGQEGKVLVSEGNPDPLRDSLFVTRLPVVTSPLGSQGEGELAEITGGAGGNAPRSETIGRVEIGFSTASVEATLFKITIMVVFMTVIFVGAGVGLAYLFAASITRPVSELVTATQKVAHGDLDYRIEVSSRDEIGDLAFAFNKMTEDLKSNLDELAELNNSLEQKVRERTLELERANEMLRQSNLKILEADRMKTQFLTRMSHDLRTPLNAILGFSSLLIQGLDGNLPEKAQQDVRVIESSGYHLLALINNILDLAKIEAGKMELRREPVNLERLIDEVVSIAQALVGEREVRILKQVEPLPEVWVDRTKILQILLNLLGNSVKFTSSGTITVKAGRSDGGIEVRIADTGIGIKKEDQQKIFREFGQLSSGLLGKVDGSGLGLVITKKLVEMHGGKIWMKSEAGRGSTFTFWFPLRSDDDDG